MIVVHRRTVGIPYHQKWFARKAPLADSLKIVAYLQYLGTRKPLFFARRSFWTIHIDLVREPELIMADMHANVRYEIRRAERDGLDWQVGIDPEEFASFHHAFAADRGIRGVSFARLLSLRDSLLLSGVSRQGKALVQHAYVVDDSERRARFLYSSSARFAENDQALVGRANRWCHWNDMMYLRERGVAIYDLGGLSTAPRSRSLAGINDFKVRLGGKVVREDHWLSPLYCLASLVGAQ